MQALNNLKNRNNSSTEYISLLEATRLSDYSQEYLSLRARQGKLRALKLGRNWVTKKEWLKEYSAKAEGYNQYINSKKKEKKIVKAKIIKHPPPKNLPVETFFMAKGLRWQDLRPVFIVGLTLVLIMAGGIFGKENLIKTYDDFSPYTEEINKIKDPFIEDTTQGLIRAYRDIESSSDDFYLAAVNYQDTIKFTSNVFGEYGQWLKDQILETWFKDIVR